MESQDINTKVDREWAISDECKKLRSEISQFKGVLVQKFLNTWRDEHNFGGLTKVHLRDVKVEIRGRSSVGKTSLIRNLLNATVSMDKTTSFINSNVETAGVQVLSCYWPVRLLSNDTSMILFNFKFWDIGFNNSKKYSYLSTASHQNAQVILFVFAMNDRASFVDLQEQLESEEDKEGLKNNAIRFAVCTKKDAALQAQVTKEELHSLSHKYSIPIYLVSNTPTEPPFNHNKDMIKILNDIAECLIAEDHTKCMRLFKNESRLKISVKRIASPTAILQGVSPPTSPPLSRASSSTSPLTPRKSDAENQPQNSSLNVMEIDEKKETVNHKGGPVLVSQGHPSFELVYEMLHGIRTAVVESFVKRAFREDELDLNYSINQIVVLPKDFQVTHKFNYTTTAMEDEEKTVRVEQEFLYNFSFTDYAPFVFYNIRSRFGFNNAEYLDSLTKDIRLYELRSPGKSGSFFYYSLDFRFIIKTVTQSEAEFMTSTFLRNYYQYIMQNPNSMLCTFLGMHMLQAATAPNVYFVVMNNTFSPEFEIHERYDLKGSTVGRYASEQEKVSDTVILKDLDIKRKISIREDIKKKLFEQLEKDTKLLADNNIMDYSFLLGVHKRVKSSDGNGNIPSTDGNMPSTDGGDGSSANPSGNGQVPMLKQSNGALVSKTGDELYFMSIIDIFQQWNMKKKMENSFKSLLYESGQLSAVAPSVYRERFLKFIAARFE